MENEKEFIDITIEKQKAKNLSAVALAFVGDAVYSLYVREYLVTSCDYKTEMLHKMACDFVKAKSQSQAMEKIIELFDEEEKDIYMRARNTKLRHFAKGASIMEYRRATGFEAVIGYLHLTGNKERLKEIITECFKENE